MQPSREGKACSFARMKGNGGSYDTSDWVKTHPNGLTVPSQFADELRLAMNQHGAIQQTATSSHCGQRNVVNVASRAPAWTGEQTGSYPYVPDCAAPVNNLSTGMNPASQHLEMDMYAFGDVQSNIAAIHGSLQRHPHVTQTQQLFNLGGEHELQHQSQPTAISPGSDFFRNEIAGQADHHQQSHIHPMHNNHISISALTNHDRGTYAIDPAEATLETAALLRDVYGTSSTLRLRAGQDVPMSSSQTPNNEVINLDTPTKDSSQMTAELFFQPEPAPEQLERSEPTQLDTVNTPSPNVSPSKSVAAQSGNNVRDSRNVVSKRFPRRTPSPSIDVDNDDNNACRGRNRPVHEVAIDLSKEPSEETISKLKRQERLKSAEPREESYKIPKKPDKGNQIATEVDMPSRRYQEPLHRTHRKYQDPPPRPFQKNADVNQSPRRSPRLTKNTRSANIVTGSGSHAPSENSPGDCQLPLGGIPRANRVRTSDGNNFMNRNRFTAKRQRPNRARDANPLQTGCDDPRKAGKQNIPARRQRNVESQNRPAAQRPKRRTKQEGRTTSGKDKSNAGAVSRKSCVKELVKDDSEDEFFTAMNRRKALELSSQECQEKHPGGSPLSNTVGDGSHSDDDDIGAGGNELSSDDDTPPPPKRSPRGSRNRRGNSRKRARFDEESARTSRMARRKTTVSAELDTPNDYDDGSIAESRGKSSNGGLKEGAGRSPNSNKTREDSMNPSSPVDLVSPASSRSKPEKTRRPTRFVRKTVRAEEKTNIVCTDDSDEDFDNSRVRGRGHGKFNKSVTSGSTITHSARKRLSSSRKQENAQSNTNIKKKNPEATNVESGTSDGDAVSSDYSQEEENSDAAGEFVSQEQGSQPIQLKVKTVRKRKKANPKEFPEKVFKKMSTDELAIVRIAFIKRYPAPPSNMQAQGRYEAAHGTEMSAGMVQRTWEAQLKPWSERWWKLYLNFNTVVREKKLRKPRDKDPTIKEKEVKKWVDEYYEEHGDAKPTTEDTTTREKAK